MMSVAKKLILILSSLIFCIVLSHAENQVFEYQLHFKGGDSTLDPNFANNASTLANIDAQLAKIATDSSLHISAVTFTGTASPEGSLLLNKKLSAKRAGAIESYIRARVNLPSDDDVTRNHPGVAWEGLYDIVEASDISDKSEILKILRNVPETKYGKKGALIESRKLRLMNLNGGRPWKYMYRHFFPSLRSASTVIITITTSDGSGEESVSEEGDPDNQDYDADSLSLVPPNIEAETFVAPLPEAITKIDIEERATSASKPFYMDLRSNMLYDAAALPNIGIEFYAGKNISIGANWTYGWWDSRPRHLFWRAYGGELNARYWFGSAAREKPLTGHHIGIYAGAFIYDFEFGGKGNMGGQPGKPLWHNPSYMAGVEYGYSLPIARHFNIDFSVGLGYLGGKYFEYLPIDGHYVWERTLRRNWFGPTKAEISIVWLLGKGNCNARKEVKK